MKKSLFFWQSVGFIFTSISGTLLHFLYDWSGKANIIAPFSAVNESVWEHMKLLFVPIFLFALFEYKFLKTDYPNFWCGKLIGTILGLIIIPTLYYTYTGALGVNADWYNITIYFIASAVLFFAEVIIIKNGFRGIFSSQASLILLLIIGIAFVIFTFFPIHIPLFQDPISKLYGIEKTALTN